MNAFENWFCGSGIWRFLTRRQLLPWLLANTDLGDHVLELGAGPGAATPELRRRASRVTSLDYDAKFASDLHHRLGGHQGGAILQGDATTLPFRDNAFSAVVAVLVLHHLKSREFQHRALLEIFRILRPGGVVLAVEIQDRWLNRISHLKSTFVPLSPDAASESLAAAGFTRTAFDLRGSAYRVRAFRPSG